MERKHIYELIDKERHYQDAKYPPNEVVERNEDGVPILTRRQRNEQDFGPSLADLVMYVDKAMQEYLDGKKHESIRVIAKIAAFSVKILENYRETVVAVNQGLRPDGSSFMEKVQNPASLRRDQIDKEFEPDDELEAMPSDFPDGSAPSPQPPELNPAPESVEPSTGPNEEPKQKKRIWDIFNS